MTKTAIALCGLALACASFQVSAYEAVETLKKNPGALDTASCAKPEWPQGAQAAGKSGAVLMLFLIGPDGKVRENRLLKSSGHPELDDAARTALSKCAFKPGTIDGKPATGWVQVQYVWNPWFRRD